MTPFGAVRTPGNPQSRFLLAESAYMYKGFMVDYGLRMSLRIKSLDNIACVLMAVKMTLFMEVCNFSVALYLNIDCG